MRATVVISCALLLSGCAHDVYSVSPGGPGSQARLADDLWSCKQDVLHRYFHQHSMEIMAAGVGGGIAGGLAGGVVAGAVTGGVVGAAATQISTNGDLRTSADIDPAVERCMLAKGYTGTSEN